MNIVRELAGNVSAKELIRKNLVVFIPTKMKPQY